MGPGTFGPVTGSRYLFFGRLAGAVTNLAVASNGQAFTEVFQSTADASDDVHFAFYRDYTGAEDASIVATWTTSQKGFFGVWEITGYDTAIAPESTEAVGTGANPDPPNITPAGGPKDFLILVFGGLDGETQNFTAPSGYTEGNTATMTSGTGGAAASNCRGLGVGQRFTNISSENPAAFTAAAPSNGWTASIIAIHPAGAATPKSLLLPTHYRKIAHLLNR